MRLRLNVRKSSQELFEWRFDGGEVVVGRSEAAQLRFNDAGLDIVSGRHARISEAGAVLIVEDLDSTNGTFLNQVRIFKPTPLRMGDEIMLGQAGPRLEVVEFAASWAPPPVARSAVAPDMIASQSTRDPPVAGAMKNRYRGAAIIVSFVVSCAALLIFLRPARNAMDMRGRGDVQTGATAAIPAATPPSTVAATIVAPLPPPSIVKPAPSPTGIVATSVTIPAEPPPLDWQRVVERVKPAVVLIGWENEGRRLPVCTGWAIGPRTVATLGYAVEMMKKVSPEKARAFVMRSDDWNNVVYVETFMLHPGHEAGDAQSRVAQSDESFHRNLGILGLAVDLPASGFGATDQECATTFRDGTECRLITFPLRRSGVTADDQITYESRTQMVTIAARIGKRDLAPSMVRWARFGLDSSDELFAKLDLTGGVVVNEFGKVVGFAYRPRDIAFIQPIPPLAEISSIGK